MKTIHAFFRFESRRFFGRRNTIIVVLLFFFGLLFIKIGIDDYKGTLARKAKFQQVEKAKVDKYVSYRQYGTYGYRTMFVPAPISVFFADSGIVPDMNSFVDSGERLNIYLPLKGKNIFTLKRSGYADFSGILLYFGSLLAALYGFETFACKEYLKFLSSLAGINRVFRMLIFCRALIVVIVVMALVGCGLILAMFFGVYISMDSYAFAFLLMVVGVVLFFFIMGAAFGTVSAGRSSLAFLLITWFALLFLVPPAIHKYIEGRADNITPVYQLEMEKFTVFSNFEKKAMEKEGKNKYGKEITPSIKEMVLGYFRNEFKQIQSLEEQMRTQMRNHISHFQGVSLIFPTTFYTSVNSEISSRGYGDLLAFYRGVHEQKRNFVKFYIKKLYLESPSNVVPFIENESTVYIGQSRLPQYFVLGSMLTVFYIFFLALLTFFGYKRILSTMPCSDEGDFEKHKATFKRGEYKVFQVDGDQFACMLFNHYSGSSADLPNEAASDFLYLCHPDHIPPDATATALFEFTADLAGTPKKQAWNLATSLLPLRSVKRRISRLKKYEKGAVLNALQQIARKSIFIIDDVTRGMPPENDIQLKEQMEVLANNGALSLFLTSDSILLLKNRDKGKYAFESSTWSQVVDTMKQHYENKDGKTP